MRKIHGKNSTFFRLQTHLPGQNSRSNSKVTDFLFRLFIYADRENLNNWKPKQKNWPRKLNWTRSRSRSGSQFTEDLRVFSFGCCLASKISASRSTWSRRRFFSLRLGKLKKFDLFLVVLFEVSYLAEEAEGICSTWSSESFAWPRQCKANGRTINLKKKKFRRLWIGRKRRS